MGRKNIFLLPETSFLKKKNGLTLTEIVIVIAILAILIIVALLAFKPKFQIGKARDSQRKADLKKISHALDEYLNDKGPCYPSDIYSPQVLSPFYLEKMPVDPEKRTNYADEVFDCNKYVIYADLETENRKLIYTRNQGNQGNYIVTSSNFRLFPTGIVYEGTPGGEPVIPTSTPLTRQYYGCRNCMCIAIRHWVEPGCNPSYDNENCSGQCEDLDTHQCKNNYECPEQF